jgi:hypothetical protein
LIFPVQKVFKVRFVFGFVQHENGACAALCALQAVAFGFPEVRRDNLKGNVVPGCPKAILPIETRSFFFACNGFL